MAVLVAVLVARHHAAAGGEDGDDADGAGTPSPPSTASPRRPRGATSGSWPVEVGGKLIGPTTSYVVSRVSHWGQSRRRLTVPTLPCRVWRTSVGVPQVVQSMGCKLPKLLTDVQQQHRAETEGRGAVATK